MTFVVMISRSLSMAPSVRSPLGRRMTFSYVRPFFPLLHVRLLLRP